MINISINDFVLIKDNYYNTDDTVIITNFINLHNNSIEALILKSSSKYSKRIGQYIWFNLEYVSINMTKITNLKEIKELTIIHKMLLLQQS